MITNEDITDNFVLIDGAVYRIGAQKPEAGERVIVRKNGLQYNVPTQAVRDVLTRLESCPGGCNDGKTWNGSGFTPCQHCGREDEMKMPPRKPRKKRTTKGGK